MSQKKENKPIAHLCESDVEISVATALQPFRVRPSRTLQHKVQAPLFCQNAICGKLQQDCIG